MRDRATRLSVFILASVAFLAVGCGSNEEDASMPRLASGKPLPSRCLPGKARPKATVTFVGTGRAWALEPTSSKVTCLFAVRRAGPFAWGPRGDRALLAGLEVKSLGRAPRRPPSAVDPPSASWGRPIGKSIVFVGRRGRALLKAHPAGGRFLDVTPVPGALYERVVYHPSGLALAFVLRRRGRESIWISSNLGKKPEQLVHGRFHTGFDALAFGNRGQLLYFAARHADDHVDVHALVLVGATSAPVVWRGERGERVSNLLPVDPERAPTRVALTVESSCASRRAVLVTGSHPGGVDALPDVRPSRAVGWIDDSQRAQLLVAAGGCGRPLDLYSVDSVSLRARLLVRSVDAASVRLPEQLPPAQLPRKAKEARSSFA
jgi:hypothetical protein